MLAVAIGAEPGGDPASVEGVEIPGLLLPEDLAETIRALRLDDSAGVLAPRLLLLTRPERPSSENLRKQLSTHNVECRDVSVRPSSSTSNPVPQCYRSKRSPTLCRGCRKHSTVQPFGPESAFIPKRRQQRLSLGRLPTAALSSERCESAPRTFSGSLPSHRKLNSPRCPQSCL